MSDLFLVCLCIVRSAASVLNFALSFLVGYSIDPFTAEKPRTASTIMGTLTPFN